MVVSHSSSVFSVDLKSMKGGALVHGDEWERTNR